MVVCTIATSFAPSPASMEQRAVELAFALIAVVLVSVELDRRYGAQHDDVRRLVEQEKAKRRQMQDGFWKRAERRLYGVRRSIEKAAE